MSSPLAPAVRREEPGDQANEHGKLAADWARVRARTLALVTALAAGGAERLARAAPPLGPPLWDLAHVAHFEQEWLLLRLGAEPVLAPKLTAEYDPERFPRARREGLAPQLDAVLGDLEAIRRAAFEVRARYVAGARPMDPETARLVAEDWVWGMVLRHEVQHVETLLQWAQLAGIDPGAALPQRTPAAIAGNDEERVELPAGEANFGAGEGFAYDNERPARRLSHGPLSIDRWPVSNRRYLAFVEADGYRRAEFWSPAGRSFLDASGARHPAHWERGPGGVWRERRFGELCAVDPKGPVNQISWYEAEAFARFAGARLCSEAEWERAARAGVLGLDHGALYQWCADEFAPYPGFAPWPYREYSQVHFGRGLRVLRGSSFAASPWLSSPSYRNWDRPERRQVFAGLRLAHGPASPEARF